MGATDTVASWIVSTGYEDIPPDAIQVARESCFDCVGVMLAGSVQPLGRIITEYVQENGGAPECTLVNTGFRTSAPWAALGNGTMAHALDYDDFGGFSHPTAPILPALLALGEKMGASGRDVLEAYVVGCEVGIALSEGFRGLKRGFHPVGVLGHMGAAAACAKLLHLDEHQTRRALGIAGSMSSGVNQNGTMVKPLHAGISARDGVMATQLAKRGWTSVDGILEHPLGYLESFRGENSVNPDEVAASLGRPFRNHLTIIMKKYPCCGSNHSMLDSLLGLMQEHSFTYEDVEKVEVEQTYSSVVMLYREPREGLNGKFSIVYNAAAALVDGKVDIDTFTDEKVKDPRIQETMKKVQVNIPSRWDEGSKDSGQTPLSGTPVKVHLKDGRVLSRNTPRMQILGSTLQNSWGMDNITAKFRDNARLVLDEAGVEEAVEAWSNVEEIKDVGQAIRLLVADGK